VVVAAGEEMAELVSEENGEQGEGEGKAGGEGRGMSVKKSEGAEKLVEGYGFVLFVGYRELRTGDEASRESEKK
jgi:hypothetical protein